MSIVDWNFPAKPWLISEGYGVLQVGYCSLVNPCALNRWFSISMMILFPGKTWFERLRCCVCPRAWNYLWFRQATRTKEKLKAGLNVKDDSFKPYTHGMMIHKNKQGCWLNQQKNAYIDGCEMVGLGGNKAHGDYWCFNCNDIDQDVSSQDLFVISHNFSNIRIVDLNDWSPQVSVFVLSGNFIHTHTLEKWIMMRSFLQSYFLEPHTLRRLLTNKS